MPRLHCVARMKYGMMAIHEDPRIDYTIITMIDQQEAKDGQDGQEERFLIYSSPLYLGRQLL